MKKLFFILCASISIVLVLCNAKKTAMPVNDSSSFSQLPFKSDISDSKSNLSTDSIAAKENHYRIKLESLFKKDSSIVSVYKKFREELAEAQKAGYLDILFNQFAQSVPFTKNVKVPDESFKATARQWVTDASAEKDETLRSFFSQYSNVFTNKLANYTNYYIDNNNIRPGEKLTIYSNSYSDYNINKKSSSKCTLEIAKLSFDKNLRPSGFTIDKKDQIVFDKHNLTYSEPFKLPGVYRLTFTDEYLFQQFYLQVSWLDCAVKFDNTKLLVFASSFKDTLPPPYKVHFIGTAGNVFSTTTDTNGICVLTHQFSTAIEQLRNIKIIVEKNEQLAFIQGQAPYLSNDTTTQYYLFTDRPVYRPESKVHFRGMIKLFANASTLLPSNTDSVEVLIYGPDGNQFWNDTLPVDKWGHFGDSIKLASDAQQGNYVLQIQKAHTPRSGQFRTYYSMQTSTRFTVDSYKKPEFELSVKPAKETYLIDEEAKLTVTGKYYFGGPLAGIPVKIRWYRQGLYHYYSSMGTVRYNFYPHGNREFIREESDTLDNKGSLSLSFKQDTKNAREYGYLIAEIIATDQSRREVREEGKLRIVKYDAYLAVNMDKYEYEIGETAALEIVAVDMNGSALKGNISIRIKKDNEILSDESQQISSIGRNSLKIACKETGTYTIEISAKDRMGKIAYIESSIRVVKQKTWDWNWERVELSSDKKEYSIGDTAVITVHTGADSTRTLCTVEGKKITSFDCIRLSDHSLQYQIPLTKELGSNIHFGIIFSGKSQLTSSSLPLKVIDSTILLKVTVDGPAVLKPGEQYKAHIKITDRSGKPVRSAFAVALVDEAIYDVAALLDKAGVYTNYYYYGNNNSRDKPVLKMLPEYFTNRVSTSINQFSPLFIGSLSSVSESQSVDAASVSDNEMAVSGSMRKSRIMSPAAAPKMAAAGSMLESSKEDTFSNEALPQPRERKEFKDLGYWNPSIVTNENGLAPLTFTMPDDLTRWRLVVIGSNGSSHLIDFKDSIVTRQDIMVKLEAPRGFVVDDSAAITGVVHNYSEKLLTAKVSLNIKPGTECISIRKNNTETITLGAGETKRVDWPVKALRDGSVSMTVSALTEKGSDAETRDYPVHFRGIQRSISNAGVLSESNTRDTIELPSIKDATAHSRTLTINYAPTLVFSLFESLDYLTGYPYGCVEQTMSRFLPNLYVASIMKRLNLRNDSLAKKIPEYTHAGLERLDKLQHGDGGWGWWENDKTDPRMTSLVLNGLRYAMQADINPDDKALAKTMYEKGITTAVNLLNLSRDVTTSVQLTHTLINSTYKTNLSKSALSLYSERQKLTSYELALLLECLDNIKKPDEVSAIITLLESKAVKTPQSVYWTGNENYSWYRQNEETTAMVLRAISKVNIRHTLIPNTVTWLSRVKRNGYWVSTKTTAAVIEALSFYLEKTDEFNPDYKAAIRLNNKTITVCTVTKDSLKRWNGHIILPDSLLSNNPTITISMNGKGRLYYSVNLQYVTAEKPVKARDSGISVSRTYTKILYTQDEKGEWVVKRIPFDGKLKSGDELEVTIELKGKSGYEHLMLEDFFPSGMHILHKEKDWYSRWCGGWWWGFTHNEPRDDRMVFFVDHLSSESRTFSYLLRAETPGKYIGLPSRALLMYEPDVFGNSDEISVEISD